MNILHSFPETNKLINWYNNLSADNIYKVNGHIHTPFSFSSFQNIEQIFELATKENIKVLGINDFYAADGFINFYKNSLRRKIFPLFNIELIGLLKDAQLKNIRINDPNNPGRIYISGKGLKYPFSLDAENKKILQQAINESQLHINAIIDKANQWFQQAEVNVKLSYNKIKKDLTTTLLRERHIAKAIRSIVFDKYSSDGQRKYTFEKIFGGKALKSLITDIPSIENEIRENLIKAGGKAFTEENENAFPDPGLLLKIIISAGGIPCYPVLLDFNSGLMTELEFDYNNLCNQLNDLKIGCIELIPHRNDYDILKNFVTFFDQKGFIILFGTEHNTPDMIPLSILGKGNKPLDKELEKISYEGACVIAAHQYLLAKGKEGYLDKNDSPKISEKQEFIMLGKAVIERFLK